MCLELDDRLEAAISEYFSCDRYTILSLGILEYEPRPDGGPDYLKIMHWRIRGSIRGSTYRSASNWIDTRFNEETGRIDLVEFCGCKVSGVEEAMEIARYAYYYNGGVV